jgi:tetratricopeptide (TPR) repeat protein
MTVFDHFWLANTFAAMGDTDRARRYLETGLDRAPVARLMPGAMWPRASILLAEGRHQEAIETFRDADRGMPSLERDLLGPLGRAHVAAGHIDSAVGAFEQLLASTQGVASYDTYFTDGWLLSRPLAHRALARIYDQRGDAEKAALHYARLIDWWRDADPEVQPQVAEAERRLIALRPD